MLEPPTPEQLAALSDGVSKLWARFHGRGPWEAKSYCGGGHLFTVMRGGLSPEEITLVRRGRPDLVRQVRVIFEEEIRDEMMGLVRATTGRTPIDYASQFLTEAGITVEIFALEGVREPG